MERVLRPGTPLERRSAAGKFLTSLDTKPEGAGKIGWNFEKFLIDRNGTVVARFGPGTKPDTPEIVAIIERELATGVPSPSANSSDAPG
jgi:glutathione peroxidase-family protein